MADTEAGGLGTVLPVCGDYLGAAEATRCTVIERASRFTRPAPAGVLARREQFGHRTWKKLREKCSQPPLGAPTCVTVPAGGRPKLRGVTHGSSVDVEPVPGGPPGRAVGQGEDRRGGTVPGLADGGGAPAMGAASAQPWDPNVEVTGRVCGTHNPPPGHIDYVGNTGNRGSVATSSGWYPHRAAPRRAAGGMGPRDRLLPRAATHEPHHRGALRVLRIAPGARKRAPPRHPVARRAGCPSHTAVRARQPPCGRRREAPSPRKRASWRSRGRKQPSASSAH